MPAPVHPYPAGQLGSTVHGPRRERDIYAIPGSPPDLRRLPPGCSFAPHCPRRANDCRRAMPEPRFSVWPQFSRDGRSGRRARRGANRQFSDSYTIQPPCSDATFRNRRDLEHNKPNRDLRYTRYDKMVEVGLLPRIRRVARGHLPSPAARLQEGLGGHGRLCQRQDRPPRPRHDRAFFESGDLSTPPFPPPPAGEG